MALSLSTEAMKAMGFRPIAEDEVIVAAFDSIRVYEVQGFALREDASLVADGLVGGLSYRVAISASVNKACQMLMGNDFVEDEDSWAKEIHCTPPYVLIHFGPTKQHSCATGHIKVEDDASLITYDCFAEARDQIRAIKDKVLPSLISALTCAFSSADEYVRFRAVDNSMVGRTTTGAVLHDIRMDLSAYGYQSYWLSRDELRSRVESTRLLATRVNPKVSRFFQLALEEEDLLKKFLYFFLAIEIETHSTFKSIDHATHLTKLINSKDRCRAALMRLFEAHTDKFTNLRDRFVWCAICAWPSITDSDVEEFTHLKKVRDEIAHGTIALPPANRLRSVEHLAAKLLLQTVETEIDGTQE